MKVEINLIVLYCIMMQVRLGMTLTGGSFASSFSVQIMMGIKQ